VRIPQNFDSPYKATDPVDFWRRWHISLSSCLRDYIYVPLGGNRDGRWRTYRNVMFTMLIGGLWHGANWTFVAWGAYHGLLIIGYRAVRPGWDRLPLFARRAATFLLVLIGWVPFRADSLQAAGTLLQSMFAWNVGPDRAGFVGLVGMLAIAGAAAHLAKNSWQLEHRWRPAAGAGLAVLFALCLLVIYSGQRTPFLYYQF
jgi:alginate O-acetyltransferase complex protein AlgI